MWWTLSIYSLLALSLKMGSMVYACVFIYVYRSCFLQSNDEAWPIFIAYVGWEMNMWFTYIQIVFSAIDWWSMIFLYCLWLDDKWIYVLHIYRSWFLQSNWWSMISIWLHALNDSGSLFYIYTDIFFLPCITFPALWIVLKCVNILYSLQASLPPNR